MIKTAMVRARVEPQLKNQAESVFHRLGLNATQAITIFYKQVELRDGLPFDVVVPTPTTKSLSENPCCSPGNDGASEVQEGLIAVDSLLPSDEDAAETIEPRV